MSAGTERRVLLIGGTSEIGLAIVRRLGAETPVRAFLLGRNRDRLAAAAATLPGAEYELLEADALDTHEALIGGAFDRTGGFDVVILAVGVLGGQAGLDRTTIVPRPCRRRAPSEARSRDPAPRKFTRITVSDTDRSLSRPA